MAKLMWDKTGERFFETGVHHCVVYPFTSANNGKGFFYNVDETAESNKKYSNYGPGVAWNGISSISESADGGDSNPIYADDIKYIDLRSLEDLNLSLEAYMYPVEFAVLDGSADLGNGIMIGQQRRQMFGLSYETRVGNDVDYEDYSRKIHLVYGCMAAPTEKGYETINDSPEAITFSWDISTTPIAVEIAGKSYKPTSILTIEVNEKLLDPTNDAEGAAAYRAAYKKLTDALYGVDADSTATPPIAQSQPYLPTPKEVYAFFNPGS